MKALNSKECDNTVYFHGEAIPVTDDCKVKGTKEIIENVGETMSKPT